MKCLICETDEAVEKHHVRPKSKGGTETIRCCSDCAGQVHMFFNNNELAVKSLEEVMAHEDMENYIQWKKRHPGPHRHRMSNRVKSWKKHHR